MNYTKFLFFKGSPKKNEKFEFCFTDEKIKLSMEILKEIKKTLFILHNFMRIGNKYLCIQIEFKIDIDEHMAYFLKDKNESINMLKEYLEKQGRKLSQ
jgi:hypothetical protein